MYPHSSILVYLVSKQRWKAELEGRRLKAQWANDVPHFFKRSLRSTYQFPLQGFARTHLNYFRQCCLEKLAVNHTGSYRKWSGAIRNWAQNIPSYYFYHNTFFKKVVLRDRIMWPKYYATFSSKSVGVKRRTNAQVTHQWLLFSIYANEV